MSILLNQIPSDEAALLMYLAGELAPEDHAAISARLATDAGLRQRLLECRQAEEAATAAITALDAAFPFIVNETASMRRASLAIRDWHGRRLPTATNGSTSGFRSLRIGPAPARHLVRFAYLAAIAAAVLLAVGSVFVIRIRDAGSRPTELTMATSSDSEEQKMNEEAARTLGIRPILMPSKNWPAATFRMRASPHRSVRRPSPTRSENCRMASPSPTRWPCRTTRSLISRSRTWISPKGAPM